jgi:transposase
VRLVIEGLRPIASVARELGIGEGTLGNRVAAYRREHAGDEPPLNISERERLRQLEREARELRMENEFLKKVAMTARFAVTGRYENLPVAVRADVGAP